MGSVNDFEKSLGYQYRDSGLLLHALTHTSRANEICRHNHIGSNERLEFLGDSVLSLVISEYLYKILPDAPEGDMTRIRAMIVCERSLSESAKLIELGNFLQLGRGESLNGGRERTSIIADAFEALIGSIYLDGGFEAAKKFVLEKLEPIIKKALDDKLFDDYKTALQDYVQSKGSTDIVYTLESAIGPDHNKTFNISVNTLGVTASGTGRTKKDAEQEAAQKAYELLTSGGEL